MIRTFFGWLLSFIGGLINKDLKARAQTKADTKQQAGEQVAESVAHASEVQLEQERTHDATLSDQVRADGPDVHGTGGSLRKQSDDINAAISGTDDPV